MEVKKIVEGMTAPQVAQVIDENFNSLNNEKATTEAVEAVQKNVTMADDNTGVASYPEYSSTEPVAVGDVRRYEGLLYRSKEAGAYDWDPEKWERVTLKQLEDEKLSELGSEVKFTSPIASFSLGGTYLDFNTNENSLYWDDDSFYFKDNEPSNSGVYAYSVNKGSTKFVLGRGEDFNSGINQLFFDTNEKKFYLFSYSANYEELNDSYIYIGSIVYRNDVFITSATIPIKINGCPVELSAEEKNRFRDSFKRTDLDYYKYPNIATGNSNLVDYNRSDLKEGRLLYVNILNYNFENGTNKVLRVYGFYSATDYDTLFEIKDLGANVVKLQKNYIFVRFDFYSPVNFELGIDNHEAKTLFHIIESEKGYVDGEIKFTCPIASFSMSNNPLNINTVDKKISWKDDYFYFKYNDKSDDGYYATSVEQGETAVDLGGSTRVEDGINQLFFNKSTKKFYMIGYGGNYSEVNNEYIYLGSIVCANGIFTSSVTLPLTIDGKSIKLNINEVEEVKKNLNSKNEVLFDTSNLGNLQYEEVDNCDYNHIILYGQSLSQGYEAPEAITTIPISGNYMLGNTPSIYGSNLNPSSLNPLIAVKDGYLGEQPIVSLTNAFSRLFRRYVKKEQLFIGSNPSQDGKSIEKLSKECTNLESGQTENFYTSRFLKCLDVAKDLIKSKGKTINCSAIVYMQGEWNYGSLNNGGLTPNTDATNDKNEYKRLLTQLKNNMQSDVMAKYGQSEKPLFFIYQVAGIYISNKEMSINMAQIEFANENDDVFLLSPTYPTPDYNGGHLSTNGYRWYGEMIAKSMYDVIVRGVHYKPIMPKKFTVVNNKLNIDFYVPVNPLVLDTWTTEAVENYGFRVFANNAEVIIDDVTVSNNRVTLHCSQTLSGVVEVTYAGQGRNGSGNLRDSDEFYSMYKYYDDRQSQPSKRENYTPKDKEGNLIYGKRYPMYNWCANFYKRIE